MTYNLNRDRTYTPIERVGGGSLNPKPPKPFELASAGARCDPIGGALGVASATPSGPRHQDSPLKGFRVWGLGFKVVCLGARVVQGLVFRVV